MKKPQPVVRLAIRKIEKFNPRSRIRFVTTIAVLILIMLSAMLDINLGYAQTSIYQQLNDSQVMQTTVSWADAVARVTLGDYM